MGFSQAVSGMNAASSNLDVIGNNIANSATSGLKQVQFLSLICLRVLRPAWA